MWNGDYYFLIWTLVVKDFKIRYRNMSLGVLWSLLNPLVMMGVLTFIFTEIFVSPEPKFPVFLFCGLLPFNIFTVTWSSATGCMVDSAGLIKRLPVPREIIPIATVLSCCLHLAIQIVLLLVMALGFGLGVNVHWFWLPVLVTLEIIFVTGLSLLTCGLHVFVRDTRYIVESINMVMFWLVPIFYSMSIVPQKYLELYELNPLAALAVALRNILLQNTAPAATLVSKMTLVSFVAFGVGWFAFGKMKAHFYNYL